MKFFNKAFKVTTPVLCIGLVGSTIFVLAPAAEARSNKNKLRHELRLRQLRREIRRDTHNHRSELRAYQHEVTRYPPVIPVYGLSYEYVY